MARPSIPPSSAPESHRGRFSLSLSSFVPPSLRVGGGPRDALSPRRWPGPTGTGRPRRLLPLLTWFLVVGCFLPAIRSGAAEGIRIGVMGALSGPKAPYGQSQLRGARLAVEEINQAGGVRGQKLELIEVDDHGDPALAGPPTVDLIYRERVAAILGSIDSGVSHVIAMIAVKSQVPHLTCVATDPSLTRAGSPWTFRTLADDERQAAALVGFLARQKTVRKLALLASSSRYGRMGARSFARQARQAGIQVTGPRFLGTDPARQAEICGQALADRPDAVILWTLWKDGLEAVRILHRGGFSGLLAGGDGLATPEFYAAGRPEVEGVVMTRPYAETDPAANNLAFQANFRARYGTDPDSFAAHAYDTIHLLERALRRSDLSRQGLRDALATLPPLAGVTGTIELDRTGNDTRDVRLARCSGGTLRPLEASR